MGRGADPYDDDQQDQGEICEYGCVFKLFNGWTHIGTVILYGKYSKYQKDGSIKKYPVKQIKLTTSL